MAWDEARRAKLIAEYKAADPTPETSPEIVKELAEQFEESPNSVRMALVQAKVYVKKEAAGTGDSKPAGKTAGEGTKRVSKEDSINALRKAIEDKGLTVDDEILSKLTGKAAVYFTSLIAG